MCVHTYTHHMNTHALAHIFFLLAPVFTVWQASAKLSLHLELRAYPFQFTKPLIGIHCKGPCLLWLLLLLGSLLGNAPAKRNGTTDFMYVYLLVLISGFWEPELWNKSLFCFPTEPGAIPKTHLLIKSPPFPREGKKKAEWQAVLGPAVRGQVRALGVRTIGIPWINAVLGIALYDFFHTRMPRPVQSPQTLTNVIVLPMLWSKGYRARNAVIITSYSKHSEVFQPWVYVSAKTDRIWNQKGEYQFSAHTVFHGQEVTANGPMFRYLISWPGLRGYSEDHISREHVCI